MDSNFLMINYRHPNRGQHPVIGHATKTKYGYRKGGDRFLVHKDDIAAQPNLFDVVAVEAPPKPKPATPPPAPRRIEVPPPPVVANTMPVPSDKIDSDEHLPKVQQKILADTRLDIEALPGVTPAVAAGLRKANLTTVDAIKAAGVEGLAQVKFLGKVKAELIMKRIEEVNG